MRFDFKYVGFTLIELILVILLTSMLAEIGTRVLIASFKANFAHQNIRTVDNQARMALERMTRDLHAIASSSSIVMATAQQLSFIDVSGNEITYKLTNNKLMRNNDVLADDVSSLSFSYFDKNTLSTIILANIRYITVSIAISKETAQSYLRTTIYTMNVN